MVFYKYLKLIKKKIFLKKKNNNKFINFDFLKLNII